VDNNTPFIAGANVLPQPSMSYGYAAPVYGNCFHDRGCDDFIIIVVLFILLIIIGAACFCD
jgi:uncharacterized protein (TIGR01732 family)